MDAFGAVINLCRHLDYGSEKKKMSMQVLSPMYRGTCGVDHLNHAIQELVHGHPLEGGAHFLPGDKVMQKRNDYEKECTTGIWVLCGPWIKIRFSCVLMAEK